MLCSDLFSSVAAFLLALTTLGALADEDINRLPTAALISPDDNAIIGLFEAKLIAGDQARWLERNEIKRLLKEQDLDAAFGAAGGNDRLSLGKLLKADLLVLVREVPSPEKKEGRVLECVVCETRHGLRLQVRTFPSDKDAATTTTSLHDAVRAGFAKSSQPVKEIVAVSPLVSGDLAFDKNYLQTTYARLIEQVLLDQPGVVVVELNEAQAIAREFALNAGDRIERPRMPLFLLGTYRHSKTEDQTTVSFELKLQRGKAEIAKAQPSAVAPAEASQWLTDSALKLLKQTHSVDVVEPEPKEEARQLAERAKEFFSIGNFEEGMALAEASLLVNPDQEELRRHAIIACGTLGRHYGSHGERINQRLPIALAWFQRGLVHVEAFAQTADHLEKYLEPAQSDFFGVFDGNAIGTLMNYRTWPEIGEMTQAMFALRKETYLRIARQRAAAGIRYEGWETRALWVMADSEQLSETARLIEEFKDFPDGRFRAYRLILNVGNRRSREFTNFVDKLAHSSSRSIREGAADANKTLVEMEAERIKREQARHIPEKEVATEVPLREITFKAGALPAKGHRLLGCVAATNGQDLFWSDNEVYLVKEQDSLQSIWKTEEQNCVVSSAVFDGQYTWIAQMRQRRSPRLLVFDGHSKSLQEFSSVDGLPGDDQLHEPGAQAERLLLTAIEPGRVCIAGYLGRTWLAFARFDGVNKKVDVFHEAREAPNNADPAQAQKTSLAFEPSYFLGLGEDSDAGQKPSHIIAGRSGRHTDARAWPLLVDIESQKISIAPFEYWAQDVLGNGGNLDMAVLNGTGYFMRYTAKDHQLWRVSPPSFKAELVLEDAPESILVSHQGELFFIGRKYWVLEADSKKLRTVASPVPWAFFQRYLHKGVPGNNQFNRQHYRIMGVHTSNHYGVVVFLQSSLNSTKIISANRPPKVR